MPSLNSLNTQLLEFINRAVGYYHPLDLLLVGATSYYAVFIVGAAVGTYLLARDPFKRAAFVAASLAATYAAVTAIKLLVAMPRPFTALPSLHVLVSLPTDYSFPSGHAALTMALATAVYASHKRLGGLLFAFAFVVGLARIYVGVHYPLDVGVGFLLGFVIPKLLQHFFIQKESLKLQ